MKTMKKIIAILLVAAMVFSFAACGETKKEEPKQEQKQEEATKYGGTLKVGVNVDVVNLGVPQKNLTMQASLIADTCIEHLCRYYKDGSLEPWLIESYKEDPDAMTLTVALKKGIKFHDGSDFNADAVIYNWELYTSCGNNELKIVSQYEKKDDYNVVLHLSSWSNSIATSALYTAGSMISKDYVEKNGIDAADKNPCGTGPFKFVEWKAGQTIKFTKNENYWGKDADGKQLPYLDGVEFDVIMDESTFASAFLSGEIDVVYNVKPDTSMTLSASGFECVTKPLVSGAASTITWFTCQSDGPMGDLNCRKAVCSAINMDAIWKHCSSQTGAIYARTIQWGPNDVWSANPDTKGYPYDVEAAKKYLAESKYPNGFETTIIYVPGSEHEAIATLMQADLAKVGITAKLETMDEAKSAELSGVNKVDFDGLILSAGRAEVDLGTYYNRTFLPDGVRWVNQVNHYDDIVETLKTVMTCKTFEEKKAASQKLSKMVIDDYCQLYPMWTENSAAFVQKDVADHGIYQINLIIWTPETCYFTK